MVKNSSIMPILVVIIATAFTAADTFGYDISDTEMASLYGILAPFGLGGLVKSGYKTYKGTKIESANIDPADIAKLKEILSKLTPSS